MNDVRNDQGKRSDAHGLAPSITFGHQADEDFVDSWLADIVLREDLRFMRGSRWQTERRVADLPGESLLCASVTTTKEVALFRVRGLMAYVTIWSSDACEAHIFAQRFSMGDFEAALAQMKLWLAPKADRDPERVAIGFRHLGRHGVRYRTRSIEAPDWESIAANYATSVQSALVRLFAGFEPAVGGRLVLFHGPPGTGKTYVIRALARAWRAWCRVEYIADPESFFGDAQYMMQVLIDGNEDTTEEEDVEGPQPRERWRLLVVEDAGELLARDAKLKQGQALSRLLNMGEGLIGQGLRVLTLLSTNEPLAALNEAVARPGRTAVEVEFTPLSVQESQTWLKTAKHVEMTVARPMTIAELYECASGLGPRAYAKRRPLGFATGVE